MANILLDDDYSGIGDEGLSMDLIDNSIPDDEEIPQEGSDDPQDDDDEDIEYKAITEDEDEDPSSEGVGDASQDENPSHEDNDRKSNSPNAFQALALSLNDEGILTLDKETLEAVNDGESFAAAMNEQVKSLLTEEQRRISEALSNNVPTDTISEYEKLMTYLNNTVNDDSIKAETPEAEELRMNLIVQDYLNKGFSQARAEKEAKRAFDSGSDIETALEALVEVRDFYKKEYDGVLATAKAEKDAKIAKEKEDLKKLEDKFLKTEEPIKGVKLTELERKKILQTYTKFVAKDDKGNPLNEIQKYAVENPIDYQYNLAILFSLTDGFKDLGKVIHKEVKAKSKTKMERLSNILSNPGAGLGYGGGTNFGNDKSPESSKGVKIFLND